MCLFAFNLFWILKKRKISIWSHAWASVLSEGECFRASWSWLAEPSAPGPWAMRRYFSVSVNCIFQIFPKYFLNFSTQFCVFGIFLRAGKYFPPSWLWLPLSAAGLWSIRGGGAASWDDHRSPLSNLGLSHNTFHDTVQCHVMSHYVTSCHTILFMTVQCHIVSHDVTQYFSIYWTQYFFTYCHELLDKHEA